MTTRLQLNDLNAHTRPLREALCDATRRVIERGWFVLGPEVEAFEQEFAAYCGVPHAVGLGNGTEAIELALRALGIGAGDEVILAANAGMYSAVAVAAVGATPVFADVDDTDLTLDPAAVLAAIGPRTRAVVLTHLYGRMGKVQAIADTAKSKGIALVEDCAQSHGARVDGQRAGAFGDVACFSFYPTKNLGALGDGGAVVCHDAQIANRVRQLRQYGWGKKYFATLPHGRNSRLDEMQAAILRTKLPYLDEWNARRRAIAQAYAGVAGDRVRHPRVDGDDYVAHLYVVRTPQRDSLRAHLDSLGIASDVHYPVPDTQQPALRIAAAPVLPVTERACREVLTLPCYPELEPASVQRVIAALESWQPA